MAKIKITETVLRDSHQSLAATRMTTEEMVPILSELDKVGYHALEAWGGATFDSCIRFLDEDPWDRLRTIRKYVKNTKLQMLFRGQNILGYRPYADDNLKTAIDATKKEGGHVQVALSYTTSPVHSNEAFANLAKELSEMGADSICIKDMAGLLLPYKTYDLVKAIKEKVSIPVEIHTHYTAGVASMSLLKGVEAGAEIVDTAISPFALGTSQPPTESFVASLAGTEYDTGLDLKKLSEISKYFTDLRAKYIACGLIDPAVIKVNANALINQVPGGMLSNLVSQLKQSGNIDKLDQCLEEVPKVRKDAGYPPLVTPTSQIVGTQAVFNVISGERYKMVTKEFKGIIRGEYGKTPAPIDPEFRKKIIGDEQPITCRPADNLKPELDELREKIKDYSIQDEDVLTYALFDKVALNFFEKRKNGELHPPKHEPASAETKAAPASQANKETKTESKEKTYTAGTPFGGKYTVSVRKAD